MARLVEDAHGGLDAMPSSFPQAATGGDGSILKPSIDDGRGHSSFFLKDAMSDGMTRQAMQQGGTG